MTLQTTKDFQAHVLEHMTFSPEEKPYYTLYHNKKKPELGYFMKYSRPGYYDFGIGDYTIVSDFSLTFNHQETLMRFGTVYMGETAFEIENHALSSFTPSSFFVMESHLTGKQTWKQGQHFHGAEITIYKKYFEEVINPFFKEVVDFDTFVKNHTYPYLPLEIATIVQELRSLAETTQLTPLYLEGKILEAIALLSHEVTASPENAFTHQLNYGQIQIGKNRFLTLTSSDIHALQRAHDILTKEACDPPTIAALSKRVFLNEQKLKAGFTAKYHLSISQYTLSIRMNIAENLLSTTEQSVEEIAHQVGYNHSANFVKMFKKVHGKTPLAFRRMKD